MPKIITVKLLVEDTDHIDAEEALADMMANATSPVDDAEPGTPWIRDWVVHDSKTTCNEIAIALNNQAYQEGSAFKYWVIYSPSLIQIRPDRSLLSQPAFWNPETGWDVIDLATRYIDPEESDKRVARSVAPDAKFLYLPDNELKSLT